jgi:hypothetical protein
MELWQVLIIQHAVDHAQGWLDISADLVAHSGAQGHKSGDTKGKTSHVPEQDAGPLLCASE